MLDPLPRQVHGYIAHSMVGDSGCSAVFPCVLWSLLSTMEVSGMQPWLGGYKLSFLAGHSIRNRKQKGSGAAGPGAGGPVTRNGHFLAPSSVLEELRSLHLPKR